MGAQRHALLLVFLAVIKCRADLSAVFTDFDVDLPQNTMMPNERETIADCHLRFYREGRRDAVGPAFAKPAFLTEFAHIGAIGWTGADGQIDWACGGSLIWSNFIVTAAHCTANDDNVAPDVVRFGDLNLHSADDDLFAQQLRIVNIVRHPQYRFSGKYYDIALMQLERNVTIHETVAPACLWFDEEVRFTELESAGWGKTGFGEAKTPILLKVTLKPLNNENCTAHYNPTSTRGLRKGLDQHHICAGDAKMDTCPGDSGGPLQVRLQHNHKVTPFIVGLTSFGLPCGQAHPGVYTRVAPFRSWIVTTLRQGGAPEASDDQFEPQACALRYVGLRQLAVSRVVANASGVFETFDFLRQYITEEFMRQVVQLRWPGTARNNCFGSFIDHDTIVTVGDCATNAGIPPSQVMHRDRLATSFSHYQDKLYDIEEIHVHPNHTEGSYYNNIAILKINGSIGSLPACIWNMPPIEEKEMELFAVGRTDLNIYQYKDEVISDPGSMRLTPRVYAYGNDNCTLAKQYRDKLGNGLLDQHLCFGNDPFLVPQVCDLTQGGPLQRNVYRLGRYYKYVYGLSLFGRDCGFGEPAVAVRLQAHLGWLDSVLLPNRNTGGGQLTPISDSIQFINPDLELFDRCDFYDASVGLCVPVERCRGVRERLKRKAGLIFCSNGTIVCCSPSDVLDDSQLEEGSQQIERCEQLYESFRERNHRARSELSSESKPHLAEVVWVNEATNRVDFLCLGYLITTESVLASAVCATVKGRTPNMVRLGYIQSHFEDSTIHARIARVLTHPQFDTSNGDNNLALLKLASPIQPTVAVFPGCLWTNETHTPLVSTLLTIDENRKVLENEVHPQYSSDCEWVLGRPPHAGQLCMKPSMYNALANCDPSAPVYWRPKTSGKAGVEYLVGLYSHGRCEKDGYLINTRISAYLPWIIENA